MAGCGGPMTTRSTATMIGRRTAMATGPTCRPMAGAGLVMSRGAGRRITTVAGSTTTIIGPGVRVLRSIRIAVGGGRPSWLLSPLTFRRTILIAGIRLTITRRIHARATIAAITITGATMTTMAIVTAVTIITVA